MQTKTLVKKTVLYFLYVIITFTGISYAGTWLTAKNTIANIAGAALVLSIILMWAHIIKLEINNILTYIEKNNKNQKYNN